MTRINVVPVNELTREHLIAEYRELPRIYKAAEKYYLNGEKTPIPAKYLLGKGHMTFFYDKLEFIRIRHENLIREMKHRGYKPTFTSDPPVLNVPLRYWNDYRPTTEALEINRERIKERLSDKF